MTLTNGVALFGVLFSIHARIQLTEAEMEDPLASNVKHTRLKRAYMLKQSNTRINREIEVSSALYLQNPRDSDRF